MPPLFADNPVWRFAHTLAARRPHRRGSAYLHRRQRVEFPRVNQTAGTEPLRPELSGLEPAPPALPERVSRVGISLDYRWNPSREFQNRESQTREMNSALHRDALVPVLPPFLTYVEDTDVAPTRLRPYLDASTAAGGVLPPEDRADDLHDLEEHERRRATWTIQSLLPTTESDYLSRHRPLLPRRYTNFVLHSPYPRLAAGILAAAAALAGFRWVDHANQDAVMAAGQYHSVRGAFARELDAARAFGVNPRALVPLQRQATRLAAVPPPTGLSVDGNRAHFYRDGERRFKILLRDVRALEQRALTYWTGREGATYAPLMNAVRAANGLGLGTPLPMFPPCGTATCFQRKITAQTARTAWLRETTATLRVYGARIAAEADSASAARVEVSEARNLRALVRGGSAPVPLTRIGRLMATATKAQAAARVGALAHLDVDALHLRLVAQLPRRAVLVSLEEGSMTLYQARRTVYTSPIVPGPAAATGAFHIQAMQPSVPAVLWNQIGQSESGAIADWMVISPHAALQAAPWRQSFGPAAAPPAGYAPAAPASIDLPPQAAARTFAWVSLGTGVLVY
jgi:hypothetical protein